MIVRKEDTLWERVFNGSPATSEGWGVLTLALPDLLVLEQSIAQPPWAQTK